MQDRVQTVAVFDEGAMRLLIDSEALEQAVYLYRPIFDDRGEEIVDLEIAMVNRAGREAALAEQVVEGALASHVFVDVHEAIHAANLAWQGERPPSYKIIRRGIHDGQPTAIHFEVSTMRVEGYLAQVSIDHTIVEQLASADARFRLMAEASIDALVLLTPEADGVGFVVGYANPAALDADPELYIGGRLPVGLAAITSSAVTELRETSPVRRYFQREVLGRHLSIEATFTEVVGGQVMVSARELATDDSVRTERDRNTRVLRAIGAGAFGTIAVYEPRLLGARLTDLVLLWSAAGQGHGAGALPPLDPTSVLSASDVLAMAQVMLQSGETRRSGWVPVVDSDGHERSVEFTLVLAGDRFVLEFVERTEELAARTALATVTAASAAQRSFLSRVSHELRSPLNVINGYSQLLARLHLPDGAVDHLVHIQSGVERMVHLIDDLLLLGQLDQGLVRIDTQPIRVHDIASDVLAAAATEPWWREGAVVPLQRPPHDAAVSTDRARFATIALLIAEASVAAAAGHVLEIGPFLRGTRAGLQFVTPAESPVVESVWRPLVGRHAIPGAGLGLAVARELAKALDVNVEVRDIPGDPARAALVMLSNAII